MAQSLWLKPHAETKLKHYQVAVSLTIPQISQTNIRTAAAELTLSPDVSHLHLQLHSFSSYRMELNRTHKRPNLKAKLKVENPHFTEAKCWHKVINLPHLNSVDYSTTDKQCGQQMSRWQTITTTLLTIALKVICNDFLVVKVNCSSLSLI